MIRSDASCVHSIEMSLWVKSMIPAHRMSGVYPSVIILPRTGTLDRVLALIRRACQILFGVRLLRARSGWKALRQQGLPVDRSTLAGWVGAGAAELKPVYLRMKEIV